MRKILFFLLLTCLILPGQNSYAVGSLSGVGLSINPQISGSQATWTINFTIPEDTKVGHIVVSLGGYQPSLSSATLSVSGLPKGTPVVGKSNPNCVFNCDDIRYYFTEPITVKKNTAVTFTLSNVANSSKSGVTGINYINVYSSKYPQMTLSFSGGEKLVSLAASAIPDEDGLIPATTTNEGEEGAALITQVKLDESFFQEGSQTTKFDAIKDPTKVAELTLDLLGKARVVFGGTLDLSTPEAIKYFDKLGDYLIFGSLSLEVKKELLDYFKVPLEVTFYDLPYVWEPDVLKDDMTLLGKADVKGYHYLIYDNQPQFKMIIDQAGIYRLVPRLEFYTADNQKLYEGKESIFSGKISDPMAKVKISLNGKEAIADLKPDSENGEFSFKLDLVPGANLIEIQAESALGRLDKISRVVDFVSTKKETNQNSENKGISPLNLIAVGLALVAIVFIWAIRHLARKRK